MPYPHVMHTGTRRIEFDPVLKLIRETPLELRHRGSVVEPSTAISYEGAARPRLRTAASRSSDPAARDRG